MDKKQFLAERKGANVVRGMISAIATLAFGVILVGFFFSIGDSLVPSGDYNTTYQKIKSQGALILYGGIIIPLAILMGVVMAIIGG